VSRGGRSSVQTQVFTGESDIPVSLLTHSFEIYSVHPKSIFCSPTLSPGLNSPSLLITPHCNLIVISKRPYIQAATFQGNFEGL